MLTHFLDAHNLQFRALQAHDEPVETIQVDRVLTFPASSQGMEPQARQPTKLINRPDVFDDLNAVNVTPGNFRAELTVRQPELQVALFQTPSAESDFQVCCLEGSTTPRTLAELASFINISIHP